MCSSEDDATGAAGRHKRCVPRGHSAAIAQADQDGDGTALGLNHKLRSGEMVPALTGRGWSTFSRGKRFGVAQRSVPPA